MIGKIWIAKNGEKYMIFCIANQRRTQDTND